MAYVNVKNWSADQVTDWLKGLDNVILQYTTSFLNNLVTGHQLLNLRADDLEHLGVKTVGHQEIILEALEHLRSFHFELDKENLQKLALRLSCAANSLYKELLLVDDDCTVVPTQTMSDVHNIITTIKPLVCWLDRSPFAGDKDYIDNKQRLLELGFEMATSAHRDIFSEQPAKTIRKKCEELAKMADHIIQEISDPMILQPASLDLATLKKKDQELGFFILPSNHAIHQIAEIKYGSPAHGSAKIEEGDEIVQVNYQTVVGWQRKKVMILLQESPPDIVLTLKKRPRHTKVYGQIYMKPYRLPSRRSNGLLSSRWNDNIPSPALFLDNLTPITIPGIRPVIELPENENENDEIELVDDIEEPLDSPLDGEMRIYPIKPRPILQRRNSFTGSIQNSRIPYPKLEECVQLLKKQADLKQSYKNSKFDQDSKMLRDKSASCMLDVELTDRPTTVIGLPTTSTSTIIQNNEQRVPSFRNNFIDNQNKPSIKKRVNFDDMNNKKDLIIYDNKNNSNLNEEKSVSVNSLASLTNEDISFIDEGRELTDRTSMSISDIDNNKLLLTNDDNTINTTISNDSSINKDIIKDSVLADVNIHDIIKKFDEQQQQQNNNVKEIQKPKIFPRTQIKKLPPPEVPQKPLIIDLNKTNKPIVPIGNVMKIRGRLDKSHSTPAYDLTDEEQSPIEMYMTEKTTLIELPDSNPVQIENNNSSLTEKIEPFTETKYQLGIPVVDVPSQILPNNSVNIEKPSTSTQIMKDDMVIKDEQPPTPPPRTFGVVDMSKPPAYPIDSPKPANLLELTRLNTTTKPIFEFPDTTKTPDHSIYSINNNNNNKKLNPESPATGFKFHSNENNKSLKNFDPKLSSTPNSKNKDLIENDYKITTTVNSSLTTNNENKISPTNSIVRAMIYSNKNKNIKKRTNNLTTKRRKVTVNDLNPADIQGYLYQRLRSKHNQNVHWEKRWFVLLGNCLYGFKTKDDIKAACLIFLSGFTVAVANEVKSRSNAFKVYHTGTVFYFSADDIEILQSWIEVITAATLNNEILLKNLVDNTLYSETDDESDNEKSILLKNVTSTTATQQQQIDNNSSKINSNDSLRKFGSLKKFTSSSSSSSSSSKKSSNNNDSNTSNGSTSLDRKWFFNKSSGHSKHSLPVPTAQFRSYRKIRNNNNNNTNPSSVTTGNFTSHVAFFAPRSEIQTLQSSSSISSVPNLTDDKLMKISDKNIITNHHHHHHHNSNNSNGNKLIKNKSLLNYVHASNPSLCNINEFNIIPNFNQNHKKKPFNENFLGLVTLEELMIRQAEEKKLNPHNFDNNDDDLSINLNLIKPDVVYGEVPIRPKEKNENEILQHNLKKNHNQSTSRHSFDLQTNDKHETTSSCFGKRLGSIKKSNSNNKIVHDDEFNTTKMSTYPKVARGFDQIKLNRSLPRTHKLQENYKKYQEHDELLLNHYLTSSTSDRNLINSTIFNHERPYEMVYCPEITTDNISQFAQNRNLLNDDRIIDNNNLTTKKLTKIKKQRSFSSADNNNKKIEMSKYSNKVSDLSNHNNNKMTKLKSAIQYTPMSLPLNQDQKQKPKLAFELNLDDKTTTTTTTKSGKFKQIFGSKQNNDTKKEKTFLGSPKLHRAIFRKQTSNISNNDINWPTNTASPQSLSMSRSNNFSTNENTIIQLNNEPLSINISPHIDYPGLEYPPVFEPETYSLADPQSSLTLLRKQGKND